MLGTHAGAENEMSPTSAAGPSLEERFRAGEELALVEIYRQYSGPMFAAAYSVLGNRDLAADAVQQAFLQAWRAAPVFDASRSIAPWLVAIARRAAIDIYRRDRVSRSVVPLDEGMANLRELSVESLSLDRVWQVWQIRAALEKLHPNERQVLQLAYFEDLTQTEIAATLGVALGTVKSRTFRAQRRLAELLAHLHPDEAGSRGTALDVAG
ncbi:RNA polymerase sigma factor [Micromonospora sp. NPDC051141]|uniref:RNA polymerase sigma factor n=1 Tax=Micromonospora sp. NPDC051141 TaxID=3364284 RepID=UPI0037A2FC0D